MTPGPAPPCWLQAQSAAALKMHLAGLPGYDGQQSPHTLSCFTYQAALQTDTLVGAVPAGEDDKHQHNPSQQQIETGASRSWHGQIYAGHGAQNTWS